MLTVFSDLDIPACLQRRGSPKRRNITPAAEVKTDNFRSSGAATQSDDKDSLEGAPTIDELEQRLGITRSRESTPVREFPRKSDIDTGSPLRKEPILSSPELSRSVGRESGPLVDRGYGDSPSLASRRVEATVEGSPVRRSYDRFKSPEPEGDYRERRVSTSSRRLSNSPKPSPEAVEEMKRRFLRNTGSPAPEKDTSPSYTDVTPRTTPRARTMSST